MLNYLQSPAILLVICKHGYVIYKGENGNRSPTDLSVPVRNMELLICLPIVSLMNSNPGGGSRKRWLCIYLHNCIYWCSLTKCCSGAHQLPHRTLKGWWWWWWWRPPWGLACLGIKWCEPPATREKLCPSMRNLKFIQCNCISIQIDYTAGKVF